MSLTILFSLICMTIAIVFIAFSSYREWLKFLFAGMGFWLVLELAALGLRYWFELPILHAYAGVFLFFLGVLTIVFAVNDHRVAKQITPEECIEHTPVYEDEPSQSAAKY